MLFDLGASNLFIENGKKLDVDIIEIESVIISHGHSDHGGGLGAFLAHNSHAKVYVQKAAFEKHYASRQCESLKEIGLERAFEANSQIIKTGDLYTIKEGITLFTNHQRLTPPPISNKGLYCEKSSEKVQDDFKHEHSLMIEEEGKIVLITGCAHNGIINILEEFKKLKGKMPDVVIGGFHLSSRSSGNETPQMIEKIGRYLQETKSQYYTCHCTGIAAYNQLKEQMGDQIHYLSAGSTLTL